MAKGNWQANPGPQSDAGNVNTDRGTEDEFDYMAAKRQTGKVGEGKEIPNEIIQSDLVPGGKPNL